MFFLTTKHTRKAFPMALAHPVEVVVSNLAVLTAGDLVLGVFFHLVVCVQTVILLHQS